MAIEVFSLKEEDLHLLGRFGDFEFGQAEDGNFYRRSAEEVEDYTRLAFWFLVMEGVSRIPTTIKRLNSQVSGALPTLFSKPARHGSGQGSKNQGEDQGPGTAADKFAIIGRCMLNQRIRDGGKNSPRNTVQQADERTGADTLAAVGQNPHKQAD